MPIVNTPPPITATAKSKPPTAKQTATAKTRTDSIEGLWGLAQFGCMLTGNLADAGAIAKHSDNVTTEIVKLAEKDDKIGSAIDKLAIVGPYGALLSALVPLVTQVLVNHNRLDAPPGMAQVGVVPKATLEAEVRTAQMQAELHAQRVRQEAEEQLARVKAEMANAAGTANATANGQAAA